MPDLPVTGYWNTPLLRMLALSASLHLAVLMIVQPTRLQEVAVSPPITARLAGPPPGLQPVLSPPAEPVPAPIPVLPRPPAEPGPSLPASADRPAAKADATPVQAAAEPAREAARLPAPAKASSPEPAAASPGEPASPALPSVPVMVDPTWYGARQLDVQPRPLKPVHPAYPPQARRRGLEGTVKLILKVDEFGVVQEVAVEEGDPPGVFDAAALEAFRTARFAPAQKNQRPVRALVYVRVVFKLE